MMKCFQVIKNLYLKHRMLWAFVFAFISTLALGANYVVADWGKAATLVLSQNSILVSLARLRQNFSMFAMQWQVCLIALWILYYKVPEKWKVSWCNAFVALLFGFANVLGNSLYKTGSWDFVFANLYQFVIAFVCMLGWACLFLLVQCSINHILDSWNVQKIPLKEEKPKNFWERHLWIISFLALLLMWLPDLITAYPGRMIYDGSNQLGQWLGITQLTNHHPFFSTWVIGSLFEIGRIFGNDNFAIFFIALTQSCIMAACYATVINRVHKLRLPNKAIIVILLFYGLHPMSGEYAHSIIKDSIGAALFVLFMTEFVGLVMETEAYLESKKKMIWFFFVSLMPCLFRHNFTYVVLPALLCICLVLIKRKSKYIVKSFIFILVLFFTLEGIDRFSLNVMGYPEGSIREMLSIPFQQTARYVRDHGDEVTEEEKRVINEVLDYASLGKKYSPTVSDPVKGTYTGNDDALRAYFKVWWKMLLKHPETYIQATLHNTYGYYSFTPDVGSKTMIDRMQSDVEAYAYMVDRLELNISHPEKLEKLMVTGQSMKELFMRLPFVGLLSNVAAYTWLLIIIALYYIKKKDGEILLILFPLGMVLLTCIASPLNNYWRYYMPIVLSMPLVAGQIFWKKTLEKA